MFRLLLYAIWKLIYALLFGEFFWSFYTLALVALLVHGVIQRLLHFSSDDGEQNDGATTEIEGSRNRVPSLSIKAPQTTVSENATPIAEDAETVAAQACLDLPKPRWGKAFSYHTQELLSSSSDSEDVAVSVNEPHALILRHWPATGHDRHIDHAAGSARPKDDSRLLRRSQWRHAMHFSQPSTSSLQTTQPNREDTEGQFALRHHEVYSGSISDRPRLQRQRTVGAEASPLKKPFEVEKRRMNDSLDETIEEERREDSTVLSDRPMPSELSFSVAEEMSNANGFLVGEQSRIPVCGSVEISFLYEAMDKTLFVTVIQASNLANVAHAGLQVKLCLLPDKRLRFKTKLRPARCPKFHECFHLKNISPEEINSLGLRIRLYMFERLSVRGQLIGECVVGFGSINLDIESTLWLTLEPKKAVLFQSSVLNGAPCSTELRTISRSDSTLSAQSMPLTSSMPELLVGLSFNDVTGHLKVEIAKGSRFRSPGLNRPVDTYVKLCLLSPNAQEIARAKTSVRRAQPNPVFREAFLFPVALFQLTDVTLCCCVYIRRSMKRKQLLGWMSLGHNSSSREGHEHWMEFQESRQQTWRWHTLLKA